MEHGIKNSLSNMMLQKMNNNNKLEKPPQDYMETEERKLGSNQISRMKTSNNLVWIEGSPSIKRRMWE